MKLIRKEGLENTNFRLNDVDISRLFKGRNEISLNLLLRNSQLYASPKGLGFEEHRGRKISQGEGLILQIRNSAKAIIFKESKVLLTKHYYLDGFFYIFPGGGQEHGETLSESVVRECLEEVDEKVVVKQLLHIREYIGKNHE